MVRMNTERRARSTGRISSGTIRRAHEAARDRRGLERARHHHRCQRAPRRSRTRAARTSSSTRWHTRRTRSIDVRALDCDFLACSPYKFYGPHLGILYGKHELLAALDVAEARSRAGAGARSLGNGHAELRGARGHHGRDRLSRLARRQRRCGRLAAARNSLRAYDAVHARSEPLFASLWDGLACDSAASTLYGVPPSDAPRTPTVSFTVKGVDSRDVARGSRRAGVFASNGNFYAATIAERMRITGSGWVRAGCACYTTARRGRAPVAVGDAPARVISASSS